MDLESTLTPQDGLGKGVKKRKEQPKMAESWSEMYKAWPMCTILIVANEFFQKFASLGTVLTLYLMNGLLFTQDEATIFFNLYSVIGGIFPLFGSILADGYIGKYRTILYASLLYGIGKVIMAGTSFFPPGHYLHPWVDFLGILTVAAGMGGIIPCVASFGGDQFEPHQEKMISLFFSMFYASINAGAMISTIMLPKLRSQSCLGQDSCYPLSFGVSAFFMIVASVIFVVGNKFYKKQPPEGNVFGDVYSTAKTALRNKKNAGTKKAHWLDYYFDTHDCRISEKCLTLQRRRRDPTFCERKRFVEDIKALLRILVMYLPIPMFWALYDQQYSVWVIQSIQMDCRIFGDFLLLPDQMQFINPVMILAFIFLFESVLYPFCSKFFKLTPLRKMVAGGVVASFAFVVSGFVQIRVETTLPDLPKPNFSFVSVMNTFDDCDINVSLLDDKDRHIDSRFVASNTSLVNNKLRNEKELFVLRSGTVNFDVAYNGSGCVSADVGVPLPTRLTYEVLSEKIHYIYVGRMGSFIAETNPDKPTLGTGEFSLSINVALDNENINADLALCRQSPDNVTLEHPCNSWKGEDFYFFDVNDTSRVISKPYSNESAYSAALFKFRPVRPGSWRLYYVYGDKSQIAAKKASPEDIRVVATEIELIIQSQGGVYVLLLTGVSDRMEKRIFKVAPDNSVSILWQLPQIAIITAAEILFSIPGYEMSYSQSGKSMKSLVQALWFFTVSTGDAIIILVTMWKMNNLVLQSFVYAGAMFVVILIFALLSIFYYEYRDASADDDNKFDDDDSTAEELELKPAKYGSNITQAQLLPPDMAKYPPPAGTDNLGGLTRRHNANKEFENLGYSKDDDAWNAKF